MKVLHWFGGAVLGVAASLALQTEAAIGDAIVSVEKQCEQISGTEAACFLSCAKDAGIVPQGTPGARLQSVIARRSGGGTYCAAAQYIDHIPFVDLDGDTPIRLLGKVK